MNDFWQKFFEFLEKHLPSLFLAFGLGAKLKQKELDQEKKKNRELWFEKEISENRLKILEEYRDKSVSDIVDTAIERGKRDGKR